MDAGLDGMVVVGRGSSLLKQLVSLSDLSKQLGLRADAHLPRDALGPVEYGRGGLGVPGEVLDADPLAEQLDELDVVAVADVRFALLEERSGFVERPAVPGDQRERAAEGTRRCRIEVIGLGDGRVEVRLRGEVVPHLVEEVTEVAEDDGHVALSS